MTALSASAMDSRNASWSAVMMASKDWSGPPEQWMCPLPRAEATPMDMFFSAPPKPPMAWPLKWESTSMEP